MPTWDKILEEASIYHPQALLDEYVEHMHNVTGNTVICYMSAFTLVKQPKIPPEFFSIIDQDIQGFMTCSYRVSKECLDLIIHSPGGDYEATKRIINYIRETYRRIRVFVPHMAMSGATMIACAADEIYMGPYSSLGPTDPQVLINGRYIPVEAAISEFNRAFEEVRKDPKTAVIWVNRLKQVPIGLIQSLEAMRKNSFEYLVDLLRKYNCKGKVADTEEIAKKLSTYTEHSSHGRGITLKEAQEMGLNVRDLRENDKLEDAVLSVYHAATVFFQNTSSTKIIANHEKRRYIMTPPMPMRKN